MKYFPLKLFFLIAIGIFELGSLICGQCLPRSMGGPKLIPPPQVSLKAAPL